MAKPSPETAVGQNDMLSVPQGQRLLRFFLTGDPGGGKFSTMTALARKGYVHFDRDVHMTEKGINWCHLYHQALDKMGYLNNRGVKND